MVTDFGDIYLFQKKEKKVTSKKKWLVVITLVLLFGMTITGCNNNQIDRQLNGTWTVTMEGNEIEMTFQNGNFEQSSVHRMAGGGSAARGTYTANNGILTIKPTHFMYFGTAAADFGGESGKWYTIEENEYFEIYQMYMSQPQNYTITGSTLIITQTIFGENITSMYTKK